MSPETQEVVLGGLDAALAAHVAKLFDVLLSDPTDAGVARFMRGLDNAVAMHDRLMADIVQMPPDF